MRAKLYDMFLYTRKRQYYPFCLSELRLGHHICQVLSYLVNIIMPYCHDFAKTYQQQKHRYRLFGIAAGSCFSGQRVLIFSLISPAAFARVVEMIISPRTLI